VTTVSATSAELQTAGQPSEATRQSAQVGTESDSVKCSEMAAENRTEYSQLLYATDAPTTGHTYKHNAALCSS